VFVKNERDEVLTPGVITAKLNRWRADEHERTRDWEVSSR
jgi:hypothetical protein